MKIKQQWHIKNSWFLSSKIINIINIELRWEMNVTNVGIGGINDHQCVSFIFIISC